MEITPRAASKIKSILDIEVAHGFLSKRAGIRIICKGKPDELFLSFENPKRGEKVVILESRDENSVQEKVRASQFKTRVLESQVPCTVLDWIDNGTEERPNIHGRWIIKQ